MASQNRETGGTLLHGTYRNGVRGQQYQFIDNGINRKRHNIGTCCDDVLLGVFTGHQV